MTGQPIDIVNDIISGKRRAPAAKAPRCPHSDRVRLIDREEWVSDNPTVECLGCGHRVKCRVRDSDLSPNARVLPHRTNGRPCR